MFQGRYKAIVCQKDAYLLELIRYIHLNPVRAAMLKAPEQYRYSGHRAYLEGKAAPLIDPRKVLGLLGGKGRYQRFVRDGMEEGRKEEYYEVEDQRFLGSEGFGEKLQGEHDEPRIIKRRTLEEVIEKLCDEMEIEATEIRSAVRRWAVSKARAMIGCVLVRRQGYKLGEVASYFGRDAATMGL